MNTMRQMGLTEVLTNDHRFTQEGVYHFDQTVMVMPEWE
jgi:hypothetical protein